jgi:hypothetical protein
VERVVLTGVGVKIVQLAIANPDAARCPVCRARSTLGKDWVLTPRASQFFRRRSWTGLGVSVVATRVDYLVHHRTPGPPDGDRRFPIDVKVLKPCRGRAARVRTSLRAPRGAIDHVEVK